MFSVTHLNALRSAEIEAIVTRFPTGARVLELGAGTGQQALEFSRRGFEVEAVDVESSNYAADHVFPVMSYDGRMLPFPDQSFDVVFSSNVLEHVPDLDQLHAEAHRVLKPGGKCVHVLPTDAWRFWTTLSAFPVAFQYMGTLGPNVKDLFSSRQGILNKVVTLVLRVGAFMTGPFRQKRHGERGNLLTEMWYFRPEWWRRNFRAHDFEIISDAPMGLFYTGHMVWTSLPFPTRAKLAPVLGSACHVFELRPRQAAVAKSA